MVYVAEDQELRSDRHNRMAKESGDLDGRHIPQGTDTSKTTSREEGIYSSSSGTICIKLEYMDDGTIQGEPCRLTRNAPLDRARVNREYRRTSFDNNRPSKDGPTFGRLLQLKKETPTTPEARERRVEALARELIRLGWEPDVEKLRRFRAVVLQDKGEEPEED